jgi:hypothetical protein
MTTWGIVLLAGFLYLGLRRPRQRSYNKLFAVIMTVGVVFAAAVRQHTP